jgi:hypothetical protein
VAHEADAIPVVKGITPRNVRELFRMCEQIHRSGLVPRQLNSPEKVMRVMQTGMEAGLSPMQSLSALYVTPENDVGWYIKAALARVRASGLVERDTLDFGCRGEGDELEGYCVSRRRDQGKCPDTTFSVSDAKAANLWGKKTRDGKGTNWTKYPKRMLQHRAVGHHLYDNYSDVLMGLACEGAVDEPEKREPGERVVNPKAEELATTAEAPKGPDPAFSDGEPEATPAPAEPDRNVSDAEIVPPKQEEEPSAGEREKPPDPDAPPPCRVEKQDEQTGLFYRCKMAHGHEGLHLWSEQAHEPEIPIHMQEPPSPPDEEEPEGLFDGM